MITSAMAPRPCSPPSTLPPARLSASAWRAIATRNGSNSCAGSMPRRPSALAVHLIADNYATHKHPKVQAWLKRHPRFHMHFTPTSASWLNQVERFFGLITEDRIRCGVFKSVAELETAILQYLDQHNADPKPFVWTASATSILEKVARGRQTLESLH